MRSTVCHSINRTLYKGAVDNIQPLKLIFQTTTVPRITCGGCQFVALANIDVANNNSVILLHNIVKN